LSQKGQPKNLNKVLFKDFVPKPICTTLLNQNNSISFKDQPANIQKIFLQNNSILINIQEIENGNFHLIHPSEIESQLIETRIDGKLHFKKPLNYFLM
jgi:hypothetical protein